MRNKRLAGVDKNLSGPPSRSYGASLGAAELESGWEVPSLGFLLGSSPLFGLRLICEALRPNGWANWEALWQVVQIGIKRPNTSDFVELASLIELAYIPVARSTTHNGYNFIILE